MLLTLQALVAVQTGQVEDPQRQFVECPSGVFVRPGQQCPRIGPHPAHLFFDWDRAELTEVSRRILEFIAESTRRRGRAVGGVDLAFLIEGYADRSGSASYNLHLSRRRAEAVRDHLVSLGVQANLIGIAYFGEDRPLRESADGVAEPDNRRVVVRLVFDEESFEPPAGSR